ncbi:MAG: LacI family DNA-binding transcriptional regulator [Candidatus Limnocylindrales bacterium]
MGSDDTPRDRTLDTEPPAAPAAVALRSPDPEARRPRLVTTMRDIASIAGVSQSTVSRVLNDAPTRVPIAPETRERVTLAARRLGYRPNPLARGLRGAATMLIGAVVRDFSDPFFAAAIEALAIEAMARGYNVVLGHAHGRVEEGLALTAVLETRHCDAIVMLGDMQDQPRLLDDLRHTAVPVVALWQGTSPIEFPTMNVDERGGIHAGLRHLTELGHERIAFVSGRLPGDNWSRQDAYIEFMTGRFGAVPDGYVQPAPNTLAGGEDAVRRLLELAGPPTAVVTSTDLVAVGVLHAAYSLGRTVPVELSVVGFDDLVLAAHTVPALTTMRMPIAEIVAAGVKLAVDLARDTSASREPRVTVFKPSLIIRQSTAAPPAR